MILAFVLGVIFLLLSIMVVSLALGGSATSHGVARSLAALEAVSQAPAEMRAELDKPFADRVLHPLQQRALSLGRRLSGADAAERIRRKLDLAGNPRDWSIDRVISVKTMAAIALAASGFALSMIVGASIPIVIVAVIAGALVGFFGPDMYLYQRTYDRSERIQKDLADAIDLMTISVEAGLGFDAAVQQVARNTEGPVAEEFSRVLREMQLGMGRAEALRALNDRTNVADLRSFVGAMVQAEAFGIPIAQVLRVQSTEMRVKRRQRAEMKAQQVPVKITVPLIFFILPCLFAAVLGPMAISILDSGI